MPWLRLSGMLLLLSGMLSAQEVSFSKATRLVDDRHVVAEGETLYGIARRYSTSVAQLKQLNPELSRQALRAGMTLRVPLAPPKKEVQAEPIVHRVARGETLYSIARRYGETVETLMKLNALTSPQLREGQRLVVGYESGLLTGPLTLEQEEQLRQAEVKRQQAAASLNQPAIAEKRERTSVPVAEQRAELPVKGQEIKEHGMAIWSATDYDEGNFYALHPTAPKGTEIVVHNPMNGRSVVVKVIGRLPKVNDNSEVIIRISQSAARRLQVLDERFIAQISYRVAE